jgi:glycosyltransferase involved in cell wall biosynthesis
LEIKQRRIIFIISSLTGGGAEKVILNILKYLDRKKYNISLILFEYKGEYLRQIPSDVKVYDLRKKNRFSLFKIIFLLAYNIYPKLKPDIIVSFLEYTNILTIISRKFSWIKPAIVISERNYASISLKYKKMSRLRSILVKRFYPQADKIVAVSKLVAQDLIKNYGINNEKVKVIYNGVPLKYINSLATKKNIPEVNKNIFTIIACGRLTRQKNYPLLLESFSKVVKSINANLLILGKGEDYYSLDRLSYNLRIKNNIKFLGFKNNPYKYIANSDLFILSSDWEGFPNVILEAMVCGVPVISTQCSAGPDEIITNKKDGLLVPVNDVDAMTEAIFKLFRDKKLRKSLGKAGRKRVEEFRLEKMIAEYEEVFDLIGQ